MFKPFKLNSIINSFEKVVNLLLRKVGGKLKLSDLLRIVLVKVIQSESFKNKIDIISNEEDSPECFPHAFASSIYRALNNDLANLNDDELKMHYNKIGCREGRLCSSITNRMDFISLISNFNGKRLEIGPFCHPVLENNSETYFSDYFDTEELKQEAIIQKQSSLDVPFIDFPTKGTSLKHAVGDNRFSIVVSSHNIEHYPCLITHFQEVSSIMADGGYYFLIVPDKRFTADYYQDTTILPEVLAAYAEQRKAPSIENALKGIEFVTHAYPQRHWLNDHGNNPYLKADKTILNSLERITHSVQRNEYNDLHCWRFTPQSFSEILGYLNEIGLINLKLIRLYPTLFGSNEFFAVLKK